jgi:hypothetical protein
MAILIKNNKDRVRQAQEQEELALTFEKSLQRKLNPLVRNIVDDFSQLYSTTGRIIDATNYNIELESILTQSYRKINNEFSMIYFDDLIEERNKTKTEARKTNLDKIIDIRTEIEPIIAAALITWAQIHASQESRIITKTWNKIIKKRVDNSIAENILKDNPIDDVTIAAKTKNPLMDELLTHDELIALQEAQTAAGNAKFVEVKELDKSLKANQTISERIDKTWHNVGINVRDAHKAANNQRREINDWFLVGGELLMYPRDSSGGASLANIINCKCKVIYM